MNPIRSIILALLAIAGLFMPAAFAQSYSFMGNTSGNWATASNWFPIGNPGPGDSVTIDWSTYNNTPQIFSGSFTIASLTITGNGGTGDTSQYGTLIIKSGATLTVTNSISMAQANISDPSFGGSTVNIPSACTLTSNNSDPGGTFPIGSNIIDSKVIQSGNTTLNSGTLAYHGGGAISSPALLTVINTGRSIGFGNNVPMVFNSGTLLGSYYVSGTLTINTALTTSANFDVGTAAFAGLINGSGSLNTSGKVAVSASSLNGTISIPTTITGPLSVDTNVLTVNAAMNCSGAITVKNGGSLNINAATTFGGALSITGIVDTSGAVVHIKSGVTLTCNSPVTFDYADFTGAGTLSLSSSAPFTSTNGSAINSFNTISPNCVSAAAFTVQSGTLEFDGGGSCNNTLSAQANTQLGFGGGTFVIGAPGTFAAPISSRVYVANATLTINNSFSYGSALFLDGGHPGQAGTVNGSGTLTILSGGQLGADEVGDVFNLNAIINSGANLTVDNSSDNSKAGSLALGGAVICNGAATIKNTTLTIAPGASLACGNTVSFNTASINGTGTFSSSGTLTSKNAAGANLIVAAFNNSGPAIVSTGVLEISGGGLNSGSIAATALNTQVGFISTVYHNTGALSGTVFIANAALSIDAPLSFGGTLLLDGTSSGFPNAPGSIAGGSPLTITSLLSVACPGDSISTALTLTSNANMAVSSGSVTLSADDTLNGNLSITNGSVNIAANRTLTCNALAALSNAGSFGGTGTLSLGTTGALTGSGSVAGNLVNAGNITLGAIPGILSIGGNYTQNGGGVLSLKIGGRSVTQFDHLALTGPAGTAALNGALTVSLANGFTPSATEAFDILTSAAVSGSFTPYNDFGTGLTPLYGAARVTLAAGNPFITSPTAVIGILGQPFVYPFASNAPAAYTVVGTLPPGLSAGATSISGTPTALGVSNVTLNAANILGQGSAPLAITINPPTPAISSPLTAAGQVGVPFSYTLQAANFPASFGASGLPPGLSFAVDTISGVPTVAGVTSITLSSTNVTGTGTAILVLTVAGPPSAPAITSALTAAATVGQAFSYTIASSGAGVVTYQAAPLPAGLTFNADTISGAPTVAGAIDIILSATNAGGTGTAVLRLTIAHPDTGGSGSASDAGPVASSDATATPNPAVAGEPVSLVFHCEDADGDLLAYGWDFGDGTAGTGGSVSHTYAAPGLYIATVTVTDGVVSISSAVDVAVNDSAMENGTLTQFTINKLQMKLNLQHRGKDSLTVQGLLPLAAGFKPSGQALIVYIGALRLKSTLNSKGLSADKTFKLSGKLGKDGTFSASPVKFALTLRNTDLASKLSPQDFGSASNSNAHFTMAVALGGGNMVAAVNLNYVVKSGKSGPMSGTAKK